MTENLEGRYLNDQRIRLIIELTEENETYYNILTEREIIIEKTYENLVQVRINLNEILEIADEEFVRFIRTPHVAYPELVSEGVEVINADVLHNLAIFGSGVKIAVLDIGFEGYASLIGTELPSSARMSKTFEEKQRHSYCH